MRFLTAIRYVELNIKNKRIRMDCRYVAVPASRRTSRAGARQQLLDDRG